MYLVSKPSLDLLVKGIIITFFVQASPLRQGELENLWYVRTDVALGNCS